MASDGLRFFWRYVCRQKLQHLPFNVFMSNLLPYNEVNEQFSNENGNPGILLAKATFKMHQKNALVHALLRDPVVDPGVEHEPIVK